ncbi:hypothetical protein [Mariprofundus ferrooxydans]|uniref:hypothetical protein n=1 Tax=Mariprofundus ferrooxydans TaxID=314344 RepID=UPI0004763A30|nr:hypothetical protein [Mariprofundus ferrooxydans]
MSKIVTAINVMVSNPDRITSVIKGYNDTECFFIYDGKHPWSILKNHEGIYYMAYYPGNQDIASLAEIPDEHWDEANIHCVTYTSKDLGTKEAKESMAELFSIVNEKVYGMDDVLDDIINSDPPF